VQFTAGDSSGNAINWTARLHYLSSGGYGGPDRSPLNFTGTSYSYPGYESIGGQVATIASTTAADGSSVQDCVTFYVEGPESGIPEPTITSQLDTLYQQSQSYPTDGTATLDLMTGVAERESSYHQFLYPNELVPGQNPDLFNLYANYQIDAFWPTENLKTQYVGPGQYIGLMQVATTNPDAWDWSVNTGDGVNLFNGTVSPNKIQFAITYEGDIINGVKAKPRIPGHVGLQSLDGLERENMALVLYAGDVNLQNPLSTILAQQYYVPQCSGTQGTDKQGNLTCSTGWVWVVNTANQPLGVNYVSNSNHSGVRDQLQ
jgi:hypothetical protein